MITWWSGDTGTAPIPRLWWPGSATIRWLDRRVLHTGRNRVWDGVCLEISADDGPPRWLYADGTDPSLPLGSAGVARSSWNAGELELRMFGEQTAGSRETRRRPNGVIP